MSNLTDADAVEAEIENMAYYLFNTYSMLESFAWVQYVHPDYGFFPKVRNGEDFLINEDTFWVGDNEYEIREYLEYFFEEVEGSILNEIYGENCKVRFTRDGVELLPYDYLDDNGM